MRLLRQKSISRACSPRRYGFILLEVIISMIILAVTIAAIMRSFTVSLAGIRKSEVTTTAAFLAQQLLDQYEVQTPEQASVEGDFGDAYPNFHYSTHFDDVDVKYKDVSLESLIQDFVTLKQVTIDIYYDDQRIKRFRPIHLETYLMGDEKFTYQSKTMNKLY
jgi:type II secretory pathway pseudopilin PulG